MARTKKPETPTPTHNNNAHVVGNYVGVCEFPKPCKPFINLRYNEPVEFIEYINGYAKIKVKEKIGYIPAYSLVKDK